jgi:predicted Zn-dependent peptidase
VRKTYEDNYNPGNLIFIVTGKFHPRQVLHIFEKELRKRDLGAVFTPSTSCFTSEHGIYFSKENATTTKIVIGFPSTVSAHDEDAIYLNMLCGILNDILFLKLRTDLTLVYGVHFSYLLNLCGTSLMCSIYVREKNVLQCLKEFFKMLEHFTHELFPHKDIFAAVQRENYNYNNNLPYTKDYLMQYIHQIREEHPLIHSKRDKVHMIGKVKAEQLQNLFRKLYNIDTCLLVYQGKSDLTLTWKKILH